MWKFKKKNEPTKGDAPNRTGLHKGIATLRPPLRFFTYNEIVGMTADFSQLISMDGFSELYYGVEQSGLKVAVMRMRMDKPSQERYDSYESFYNEVEILGRIHHKNLVPVVGLCEEGNKLMLVFDYMAGGSLSEALLDKKSELTWRKRLQIAQGVALGLHYLHTGCTPSVIHRDIKPKNILLDENMDAKLSGFEISKVGAVNGPEYDEAISTVVCGTPGYLDPEYACTGKVSKRCDVFSFGVVLFELITGKLARTTSIETNDRIPLPNWVMTTLKRGDMENILDPLLKGRCNMESVWKVVRIANAATQENSIRRPDMTDILSALQAALRMEISQVEMSSSSEISANQPLR